MDIHKPKPFHSLKEFFSEIFVVVVGILIALSLEQGLEILHWHHQTEIARHALGLELSASVGQARERLVTDACIEQRLDDLAAVVDAAAETGRLPPLGEIAAPPVRTWGKGVWESTVGGQTADHLSAATRADYAGLYELVAHLDQRAAEEVALWSRLHLLVGPGRKVDPSEIMTLREVIGEARLLNRQVTAAGWFMAKSAEGFIEADQQVIGLYKKNASAYPVCQPVGPVPAHYGNAALGDWKKALGQFFSDDQRNGKVEGKKD